MKKIILLLLAGIAFVVTGCNQNTYSRLRDQEDRLIKNYIQRNQLNILTEEPADDYNWEEKDYYKVPGYDDLYFHLIGRGDSIYVDPTTGDTTDLTIVKNDLIVTRYLQFELTEDADTSSYWTTLDQAFPYSFHYLNFSDCEAVGWHEAVRLMKYPESSCELIVPSKQGFTTDQTTVTPYVYILKIKVRQ